MIRSRYEQCRKSITEEEKNQKVSRKDGRACLGSRKNRSKQSMQARGNRSGTTLKMEREIAEGRNCGASPNENRTTDKREPRDSGTSKRQRASRGSTLRNKHRVAINKKKKQLGLEGDLRNRHLSREIRNALTEIVKWGLSLDSTLSIATICSTLEINPRAYYRWQRPELKTPTGGGGRNKITNEEEANIILMAKNNPDWHCRKIAYQLEKQFIAFVGKSTVAKVMEANELNHPFEQNLKPRAAPPADMLLHEPWRKNLLWGMDWTWVKVANEFMYLLVLLDWYSRKILSWGLHKKITRFEVVSLVTDAVAKEDIDLLPKNELRPIVVADHGSANASKHTKENIEILGLTLWLSGIGRPTGNARTERVIGTLKNEEIKLQDRYDEEDEAYRKIGCKIYEYNNERPNSGNGGFSPNSVHDQGRYTLEQQRKKARQMSYRRRRIYWNKEISGV